MVHDDTRYVPLQPDVDASTRKDESCGWQLVTKRPAFACNVSVSGVAKKRSKHVVLAIYTCVVGHKSTVCWQYEHGVFDFVPVEFSRFLWPKMQGKRS